MLNKSSWEQFAWLFPLTVFTFAWSCFYVDDYKIIIFAFVFMVCWLFIVLFGGDFSILKMKGSVRRLTVIFIFAFLGFSLSVLSAFLFGDGKLPFVAPSIDLLVSYLVLSVVLTLIVRKIRSLGYNALDASDLLGGMIYGVAIAYYFFQREF